MSSPSKNRFLSSFVPFILNFFFFVEETLKKTWKTIRSIVSYLASSIARESSESEWNWLAMSRDLPRRRKFKLNIKNLHKIFPQYLRSRTASKPDPDPRVGENKRRRCAHFRAWLISSQESTQRANWKYPVCLSPHSDARLNFYANNS